MEFDSNIRQRHPRNKVGLAEVLRVCSLLGVRHGRHAQWLAESLELVWKEPDVTTPQTRTDVAPQPADTDSLSPDSSTAPESKKKLKLLEPISREPIGFEVLFEAQTEEIRSAVEIKPATLTANAARPRFQPLFLDRWFQGIFSAILSTSVTSREIDFRKLERSIVQGDPFHQLPFKTKPSLIKGVHLLLDRSESMQPFWRDETELVARLRRLLGSALVKDSWFEYDSLRSAECGLIWHTPMPRQFREEAPVLLVTDFGSGLDSLAARSMEWEPWLPVLQLARSSRCRVFALIPSSPSFGPTSLDRFVDGSFVWDRETSVHTAVRICRKLNQS